MESLVVLCRGNCSELHCDVIQHRCCVYDIAVFFVQKVLHLHQPKMAGISWPCPVVWAWGVPKLLRRQGFTGSWGGINKVGDNCWIETASIGWMIIYLCTSHSSLRLSTYLSVCLSVWLSVRPSIRLPLCLSVYVTLSEAEKVKLVTGPTCLQWIWKTTFY